MALKIDFSDFDPLQLILRVSDIKIWLVLSKSDQNKLDRPIFEPFLQNAFSLSIWELGAVYVKWLYFKYFFQLPHLIVVNTSSYQHFLPNDEPIKMTPEAIGLFIDSILEGEAPVYGGSSYTVRY